MLFLTGVKKECNVSHQRGREGQQFGNYRLLQLLGRGGYGEVYLGEHLYLQTQVAVKVLAASPEQWVRDLIRTEARTHARLDHPNIVRILDFGFEQDVPYLVMAYAPGGTLRTLHPRGTPLPLRRITFYVYEIAKALQYAHDQKVIHRDVKPENLLLGPGNTIQLSDFGLAVVAHQTHSLSEQDALGTTMYMAPEQARGHARPASDQYALGVLVYEWLTGYPPFSGRSTAELVLKHQSSSPPPLGEQGQPVSPDVEQAVMKALAKDPHRRWPDVLTFALQLVQACQETAPSYPGTIFTSYRGHLDFVGALAWSPDGRHVASGSYDTIIRVWDVRTGRTTMTFTGHDAAVRSVAWSPDGRFLASGSADQTARVWDVLTGKQVTLYQGHSDQVDAVAWSPDGMRLASAGDCTVHVWHATTGSRYLMYQGHIEGRKALYTIFNLAWSPSGFYLASASEDGTVQVWDAATGKPHQIYRGHGAAEDLAWTRDNTKILSLGSKAHLWEVETGNRLIRYDIPHMAFCLALSPDNRYVAIGGGKAVVYVYEVATGTLLAQHRIHTDTVWRLVWSPDGTRLASVSEREVYVWQAIKAS